MRTKERLRGCANRVMEELTQKGAVVLKAPVLIRGAECAIRFLLGAVMAGARVFGAYSPFGLGMVGASGSGVEGFSALAGACLGYLSSLGLVEGLRYAAAGILIYSVAFAFFDVKLYRKGWFMPAVSAFLGGATGFVYLSERGWTGGSVIFFLSEVVLIAGSAYFYRVAFSIWTEAEEVVEADRRQLIALFLMAVTALMALAEVTLPWQLSLGRTLGALVVMAAAWRGGVGVGSAVGVAVGLAMDLSMGGLPLYAMAYGFAGLMTGAVSGRGRLLCAVAYVLANAVSVLWTWSGAVETAILYEVFLASVLFLVVPESLLEKLDCLRPAPVEQREPAGRENRMHEYVQGRLERQASAFRGLYEQLRGGLACAGRTDGDTTIIFDRAADRVCRGCALQNACWTRDYVTTYNALNDALPAMLERGRGLPEDFPAHFASRCLHFNAFLNQANQELTALLTRRQYAARLKENRSAVCRQYAELSALLNTAAAGLARELTPDPAREKKLRQQLRLLGVDGQGSAFYDEHGRLRVEVEGEDLSGLEGRQAQARLSAALGVPLRAEERRRTAGGQMMVFTQAERFAATAGIAARRKEGEAVSGDAGTWFKGEDGTLWVLICDGMGSGAEAARDSTLALRLLEDFLRAGVEPEAALRTLSGALALRGEADGGFTTIDLLQLNLFSGEAAVYKLGAAPTYVRKEGQVTRITGAALPAGLDTSGAGGPDVTRLKLNPGDLLVMISDGVADGEEDGWLRRQVAAFRGERPKELALSVIEESEQLGGGTDDRTVVVLRLDRRMEERPLAAGGPDGGKEIV